MQMQWSNALQEMIKELRPVQRRAIAMIVTGELDGVSMTRLLKTTYSCRYCGRVIGRSLRRGEDRKRLLLLHQAEHRIEKGTDKDKDESEEYPPLWHFAASYTTYYRYWSKSPLFVECLELARNETTFAALETASRLLRLATPESAAELRRQVAEGEKDFDRRSAAIAILDRADPETAIKAKVDDGLSQLLRELRSVGDDDEGVLSLEDDRGVSV